MIGDVSDEENTESAPPSSDMNSRRFMSDMGACSPRFVPTKAMAVLLVCRPSRVSRSGWQVLGQHLKIEGGWEGVPVSFAARKAAGSAHHIVDANAPTRLLLYLKSKLSEILMPRSVVVGLRR